MRTPLLIASVVLALVATFSTAQSPGETKGKKAPAPDAAAQEQAAKLVKELFEKEYAKKEPADMLALSADLFKEGEKTRDNPGVRFVLFRESANLAARAGDLDAAFRALGILADEFDVDGVTLRVAALTRAAAVTKTAEAQQVLGETGLDLIDDAIAVENFEAGLEALKAAETAAGKAKSEALAERVKERGNELREIVKEYEGVKTARAKLKDAPNDAAANLLVGKFLCLRAGDWDQGLPYLARGDDAKLKTLASGDIAKPAKAAKQIEVADGWWDLAEAEHGTTQTLLRERACHWYSQALRQLSGVSRAKVEKRLQAAEERIHFGKELLVNGSFEESPKPTERGFIQVEKGSTQIRGWDVTQGNIDVIDSYWPPADGKRSLDMNGVMKGGIAQTFKTVKGRKYRVTFSLAGNPEGGVGERKLLVSAADKRAEFVFNTAGKGLKDMGWVTKTWEFTAVANQTRLEFASLTEGQCGPALDNVSVVALRR
jgi:choice-of-anchor C domain-containing protein